MKRQIINRLMTFFLVSASLVALTGCSVMDMFGSQNIVDPSTLTPDDYSPIYLLSEDDLPEDAYYIVHEVKNLDTLDEKGNLILNEDGSIFKHDETRYYPLLMAESNFTEKRDAAAGFESRRLWWVNYNYDEGLIPTMYQGDKLIYKSSTYIPTKYALEKFFDDGYTLGVCGLSQDLSGNYKYLSNTKDGPGFTMSTSDAVGFDGLTADSIYLVSVGDERITPMNMSMSGTVTGLNLMDSYECDIRTGTEKVAATLTCNIHYFSSAETYMFGSFSFITDIIAQLNIPSYVTTGYYTIGNNYMFRYVAEDSIKDYHLIKQADYNDTIFTYNEDGKVNGTTVGLVFDENSFLVPGNAEVETDDVVKQTYNQLLEEDDEPEVNISDGNKQTTKKMPTKAGNYTGRYVYSEISEPLTTGSGYLYQITAICVDDKEEETINMSFTQTAKKNAPILGATYKVVFRQKDGGFEIVTSTLLENPDNEKDASDEEVLEEGSEEEETE